MGHHWGWQSRKWSGNHCVWYTFKESGCLGLQPKVGGIFHLKLNIGERPIAYKYREGKMKRTLKRELKVREIAKRETFGTSVVGGKSAIWATGWCTFPSTGQHQLFGGGNYTRNVTTSRGSVIAAGRVLCRWLRIATLVFGLGPLVDDGTWMTRQPGWLPFTTVMDEYDHNNVQDVDEMVLNDPSWNTDQGV